MRKRRLWQRGHKPPVTVLSGVKGLAGARATEVRGGQCRPSRLPGTGVQPAGCLAAMGRCCVRVSREGCLCRWSCGEEGEQKPPF